MTAKIKSLYIGVTKICYSFTLTYRLATNTNGLDLITSDVSLGITLNHILSDQCFLLDKLKKSNTIC